MRIGRLIVQILVTFSFILFMGIAVLWVRSLWVEEVIQYQSGAVIRGVNSANGTLTFTTIRNFSDRAGMVRTPVVFYGDDGARYDRFPDSPQEPFKWRTLGFGYRESDGWLVPGQIMHTTEIYVPDWIFVLIFVTFPARSLIEFLRQRKLQPGLCATCRYDLRAHEPGERCPEYGTVIPASPNAAI
jgi:hypothetical protein